MKKKYEDSDEEPAELKVSKVAIDQDFLTKRQKNRVKRRKKETRKALQRMKLLNELEAVPEDLLEKLKMKGREEKRKQSEEEEQKEDQTDKQESNKPLRLVDKLGHKFELIKKKRETVHFEPKVRSLEKQKAFKAELFNSVQRVKFRRLY